MKTSEITLPLMISFLIFALLLAGVSHEIIKSKANLACQINGYSEYEIVLQNGWAWNGDYEIYCYKFSDLYQLGIDELELFGFLHKGK